MRISPSFLATIAVGTAILVGCTTTETPEESKAQPESSIAGATPSDAPVAAAQESTENSLRAQQVHVLVSSFLDNARAAMDDGNLEAAKEALLHAYELDPGNQEVNNLLERVRIQLGDRAGTIGGLTSTAEDLQRVRQAQARLEVERHLTKAQQMQEAGDLAGAIREVEDALVIFRWNPYLAGPEDSAGLNEASLRERLAKLRDAKADADLAQAAERQRRALAEKEEREQEQLNRTRNLVRTFLIKANDAFYRDRYKEAATFCEQVLSLDPDHEEAAELLAIAREARHTSVQRANQANYRYHWRELFDDLEYDDLPQTSLVEFPSDDEWDRIHQRGPIRFLLQHEAMPPEDAAIWDILEDQTIELNFEDTDLESAIEWFRIHTGANFIIDPIVLDEAADVTFNLNLPSMSVKKALDLLMNFSAADITYQVRDGVVYVISTLEATGGQVLEFYDVRDLTQNISSFPSEDFNLQPSSVFDDFDEIEIEPAPIVMEPDILTDLILLNIDRDSWDADINNAINFISGALVVRQVPSTQKKIAKLLNDLRRNSGTLINIETRFMELEDRFLQDIGVDFRGLDGQNGSSQAAPISNAVLDDFGLTGSGGVGSPGFPDGIGTSNDAGAFFTESDDIDLRGRLENLYDLSLGDENFTGDGGMFLEFTYIDDTQLEAILRAVEKSSMAQIINAQNLTVFNGQRANIVVQDHVTYVRDFEVEIAQGAVIADPIVDVIQDGTILDVRPVVSADRRFVTMEVRPTVSNLIEPIPVFRTSLAVGNEVELQLPELQIQRLRSTVTIPDGFTLMLGGMKTLIETKLDSGIPFLKDIPIISFLMGRKGTEHTRKKLMILVRAKIIIPEETEPKTSP